MQVGWSVLDQTNSNISYLKLSDCTVFEFPDNVDEVRDIFGGLPPGIIPGAWRKGRGYYARNIVGPKPTSEIIKCVDQYLFYGDPSRNLLSLGHGYEAQRKWVIERILEDTSPARNNPAYRKLPFECRRRARLWEDKVADCLSPLEESDTVEGLKATIVALKALLFTAPTEVDARGLRRILRQLRVYLADRTAGPCCGIKG